MEIIQYSTPVTNEELVANSGDCAALWFFSMETRWDHVVPTPAALHA